MTGSTTYESQRRIIFTTTAACIVVRAEKVRRVYTQTPVHIPIDRQKVTHRIYFTLVDLGWYMIYGRERLSICPRILRIDKRVKFQYKLQIV